MVEWWKMKEDIGKVINAKNWKLKSAPARKQNAHY
jgi:hypothetical protein